MGTTDVYGVGENESPRADGFERAQEARVGFCQQKNNEGGHIGKDT